MDSSYPLKTYATYRQIDIDTNGFSSPAQEPLGHRPFSIPRKPVNYGQSRTNSGYHPLIEPSGGDDPAPPRPQFQKPVARSWLRWWLPELLASLLATASLISIVVILRVYDGTSLDDIDLPASLTLNGIIAAIATIARVALMIPVGSALSQESWLWFANARQQQQCRSRLNDLDLSDAASRGAWGSLGFILRARRRWLAYVGALITIVSLAFGTFTQQLLAIGSLPITSHDAALTPGNIPRIESWTYWSGNPAQYSTSTSLILKTSQSIASIVLTVLAFSVPLSLKAAVYNGILSDEISPITAKCPTSNCTWPTTPSLAICGECAPTTYKPRCDMHYCNYTMASDSNITLINPPGTPVGAGFVVTTNSKGGKYNSTLGDRLYIANFDMLGAGYKSLVQGLSNTSIKASECALWFCIEAYNVSTTAGRQIQQTIQSSSALTGSSNVSPTSVATGVWTFSELPEEMHPALGVIYNVSVSGRDGFRNQLRSLLNGTASLNNANSAAENDWVDAVWKASSNPDPWVKKLAMSITNALRNSSFTMNESPPTHSIYDGVGYRLGVRVQWPWITLPAVSIVLSHLFLIMVIIQTSRSSVAPWKSSLLTFLFFDVDKELKDHAAGLMNSTNGLADAVGKTKVVLQDEPGGRWIFKAVQ